MTRPTAVRPLSLLLLLALLAGCSGGDALEASLADRPAPLRVLISADMAAGLFTLPPNYALPFPSDVDDGIALALALNARAPTQPGFRGLEVIGVSITYGNNDRDPQFAQTEELVYSVMGRTDVPIAPGAAGALPPPDPAGGCDPCITPGVELMAEKLREGPAVLLALGPLTDLACLVRAFPREAANLTEVLAQIGARPNEEYTLPNLQQPLRSTLQCCLWSVNVSLDVPAVELALSAPELAAARWTIAPWHFVASTLFTSDRLLRLGGDRPEGAWLRRNALAFQTFWLAAFNEPGIHPWDVTLVQYLMRPEDFVVDAVGWRIVDCRNPDDPLGRPTGTDCAGHGPLQFPTRDAEPGQLWLGNGPQQRAKPELFIIDRFVSDEARTRFFDTTTALVP
jgi:inosine-uridine nucleoside N-ribohydrolase